MGAVVRVVACLLALLAERADAQSAEDRPCRADYQIRVRYDETAKSLTGREVVRWQNESRDDVSDLWFHLYWNAFANDRTTHMVESGGALRGGRIGDDEWGWQHVTSLKVGGRELAGQIEFVSPDDQRAEDRSVFRVRLPEVVRSGGSVVATIEWTAKVPRVRRRTGYKDDFLFIAQWFPKLGVYESGNGWNCHQFHASTEFFADYGSYDVEIDLPRAYEGKIGASGVQSAPSQAADGRVVVRFSAPSEKDRSTWDRTSKLPLVHDFAWTADKDFVVWRGTFHYDEWAARFRDEVDRTALALGRAREEMRLRDVAVTLLLQPEHADQAKRHFEATCTALFFYGLWFGEYPYEHVTCVDPAWGGGGAGGMEYPTLFTAGTRMYTRAGMLQPESVTVHECGHQFWYGLVGNNEFEAGWLDEGFNTFTQNEALSMRWGASMKTTEFAGGYFDGVPVARAPGGSWVADLLCAKAWRFQGGVTLEPLKSSGVLDWWRAQPMLTYARMRDDPRQSDRNGYLADPTSDQVDTHGWLYVDRTSYRTNSYRRPATMLRTLQGLVGQDRFLRGMRRYSEEWRYRHPYPEDFFAAFEAGAQIDLRWFFDSAFRSHDTVDWSVAVEEKRVAPPRGWFPDANGAWVERAGAADEPKEDDAEAVWKTDVVVRRQGEFRLPLTVELTWQDGTKERFAWSREDQSRNAWWRPLAGRDVSARKLASAVLDPDKRYALDLDLSDNEWHAAVDRVAPLRWSERVLAQYGHFLHAIGGLGG